MLLLGGSQLSGGFVARVERDHSKGESTQDVIKPPSDMLAELSAWNNGKGIDLESWISCSGNFRLAVGYSTIFWPRFVLFEDYMLGEGFHVDSLRGFEQQCQGDRRRIEAVMNHLHIADIQYHGCEDITEERIVYIGRILKEIYEAKLQWQFPDRPCEVSFYEPDEREKLRDFEITFWQRHDTDLGARNS